MTMSTLPAGTLEAIACCLEYPVDHTPRQARGGAHALASDHPQLSAALWSLAVQLEQGAHEAEERYTAIFDVNPLCTLHVGYHVFGDTYPRGEFLAALCAELRRAGVPTNGDLPDFLPTLLRLLERIRDPEDQDSLRRLALLPAVRRMGAALAESKDPWSGIIRALPEVLADAEDPADDARAGGGLSRAEAAAGPLA